MYHLPHYEIHNCHHTIVGVFLEETVHQNVEHSITNISQSSKQSFKRQIDTKRQKGKYFPFRRNGKNVMKTERSFQDENFKCIYCSSEFEFKNTLFAHMKTKHKENFKNDIENSEIELSNGLKIKEENNETNEM